MAFLTRSLREPGGPCTNVYGGSTESRMERVKIKSLPDLHGFKYMYPYQYVNTVLFYKLMTTCIILPSEIKVNKIIACNV